MLEIGKTIVSFDVVEEHFLCDLMKCKGACCVEGDSGAPLTQEEAITIEKLYPVFEPYITEEGKQVVAEKGTSVIDSDGDLVTPLMSNEACAFVFVDEKGITKCGIEKAFLDGKLDFRKPVSCALFPIRITEYKRFDAVNYQELDICKPGRQCGIGQKLPLYKFLKEPLIRKYGKSWYEQLSYAAEQRPWEQK
ncbi:DUF3109 family protein [Mangrovibacterium lignilyticum]|uniref:DUF3109 family protein n=1 Tax=Mangrovibacterium lignilyticum TaxID=2668052 RepID=UPI0013D22059|nr:DUF3109 family protein [Mangrovibacterium lignilyticum]